MRIELHACCCVTILCASLSGHCTFLTENTPEPRLYTDTRLVMRILSPNARAHCRYATLAAATVILGVGLNAKPETSVSAWARAEAKKDLAAKEGA